MAPFIPLSTYQKEDKAENSADYIECQGNSEGDDDYDGNDFDNL